MSVAENLHTDSIDVSMETPQSFMEALSEAAPTLLKSSREGILKALGAEAPAYFDPESQAPQPVKRNSEELRSMLDWRRTPLPEAVA